MSSACSWPINATLPLKPQGPPQPSAPDLITSVWFYTTGYKGWSDGYRLQQPLRQCWSHQRHWLVCSNSEFWRRRTHLQTSLDLLDVPGWADIASLAHNVRARRSPPFPTRSHSALFCSVFKLLLPLIGFRRGVSSAGSCIKVHAYLQAHVEESLEHCNSPKSSWLLLFLH